MSHAHIRAAALLSSLLAGMALANASEQGTPTTLKGVVFDSTNRLLPEATLTLTSSTDRAIRREQTTDRSGLYEFKDMLPGRYVLEVTRVAFRTLRVEVEVAGPTEQNLRMNIGALKETVTITGSATAAAREPRPSAPGSQQGMAGRDEALAAMCGAGKPGRVGGLVIPPGKVRHINPTYPPDLARARLGGTVTLTGTVTTEGSVTGLRHIGNAPAALVEAFAVAVAGWRFTPTLLNCEPVAVELNAEATFVP